MKQQEEVSAQQMGVLHQPPLANGEQPALRHSPELPRVFADNSDKKRMIFHWAIFIGIMILALGLGTVLPDALQHRYNVQANCPNPTGFDSTNHLVCQPFDPIQQLTAGTIITGLSSQNQFMISRVTFNLTQPASLGFNYQAKVTASYYTLKKDNAGNFVKDLELEISEPINLTMSVRSSDATYNDSNNQVLLALDTAFLYLQEITTDSYMFTVQFPINTSGMLSQVKQVTLYGTIIDKRYTQFGVALRYIFFFLTIATSVLYFLRLRKIKKTEYVLEQKMIMAQSIVTILFNDPFYIITVTHPNYASNVFSVMFVVTLAAFLVVFWVTILNRINHENGQVQSTAFNWKKGAYVAILWLSCFFYYLFYSFAYFDVSALMTTASFNQGGMLYLMMWIIILFVVAFGYMIAQYIQIFLKFEGKLWRNQLFVFFSIFFIIVTFFFFFINGFDIHSFIGGRVLILYVELNTYLIYMQYMYSPTAEAIQKSQQGGDYQNAQLQQVNTNVDELRSVEINFPQDNYNQIGEEQGGSQDLDLNKSKLQIEQPVKRPNEEVIEFE